MDKSLFAAVAPFLGRARETLGSDSLKLVLAVSGGLDSSVLLEYLASISYSEKLDLVVAHFNHGLRKESDAEQKFVQRHAQLLGIEFVCEKAMSFDPKQNLEAWARKERYEFLERVRISTDADLIATAHHKNDQAETVLMRVLSGRYATNAKVISKFDVRRKLFRPLLECDRKLLEDYADKKGLSWIEDSSNSDLNRQRNWIRHKLIPLIESEANPAIVSTAATLADRFSSDDNFLARLAEEIYCSSSEILRIEFLRTLPESMLWRVLGMIARDQLGQAAAEIGYFPLKRLSESILRLETGEAKEIELGGGLNCRFRLKGEVEFLRDGGNCAQQIVDKD